MTTGKIVRLEKYGLGFVKDDATGEQYPFTFDLIVGFRGEPLKEMSIRKNSRVSFEIKDGKISKIQP